jgi:hypothetical protein
MTESDVDSVLSFNLLEDLITTGRPRLADNISQVEASGFSIVLREKLVLHGEWAPGEGSATLLVYRVELGNGSLSGDKSRRFKQLSLKFRFERDPKATAAEDPFVGAYAPAQGTSITFLPTTVRETREQAINGSVEVDGQMVPAKFVVGLESKKGSEYERHARVKITGRALKTLRDGGMSRKGDDRVEWSIQENPKEKDIPDSYGLAIIVRRPDKSNFKVSFDLKAKVDWWYDVARKFQFVGEEQRSKTYNVSAKAKGKIPKEVESANLSKLEESLKLDSLFAFTHLPEEMQPVQWYP